MPSLTDHNLKLGQWIFDQRQQKVPWKIIMRKTGLGRTKLNRLMWAASGGGGLNALGAQVVDVVRSELDRCGRVEVSVNGKTVIVQLNLHVVSSL